MDEERVARVLFSIHYHIPSNSQNNKYHNIIINSQKYKIMSTTFTREEILEDEALNTLLNIIKKNYITPQHTVDNLVSQKHIKNICETTEHFAIIELNKEFIYLSYETYTWINLENTISFPTRFNTITYYDTELEFEIARKKGLFRADKSSIPVQILN